MLLVNIINRHDINIQKLESDVVWDSKPCYKNRESISICNIKYRTTTQSDVFIRNSGK